MIKTIIESIGMLRHLVLWIPGIFAAIIFSISIYLEFTEFAFIAGKILPLGLILLPFFVAGAIYCCREDNYSPATLFTGGKKFFFPVLFPGAILIIIIAFTLILLAIPLNLMGLADMQGLSGMCLGLTLAIMLFALYYDNVAVCEETKIFASLKRSMDLFNVRPFSAFGFMLIMILAGFIVSMFFAMIWGITLADKFTPFINLNMTEQQEIYAGYTLSDWQNFLGMEGIFVTAILCGVYILLMMSFFITFKYSVYKKVCDYKPEPIMPVGEYDEKGRWYKY